MSTIASPRQSLALSSGRASTETAPGSAAATPKPPTGSLRRNRAALRDYYGLKANQSADDYPPPLSAEVEEEEVNELDSDGFDAERHVEKLLAAESLESILRTEARLISETMNLDGEKKSLVYDNYSKLIAATETIRKMRTNMDPLTPTTTSLTPVISHIAETALTLSQSLKQQHGTSGETTASKASQQQTVKWVLGAPQRLKTLVEAGQQQEAESQWTKVETLLDTWKGVEGVERVRNACEEVLAKGKT